MYSALACDNLLQPLKLARYPVSVLRTASLYFSIQNKLRMLRAVLEKSGSVP